MKQVGNDPVRKTEMVKDIVTRISKIPDPIKRSLYIKECARLVDVEEQLLINEINKIVSKQLTKHRANTDKGRLQKVEAKQLSDSLEVPVAPAKESSVIGDEFQEKDIIRILIAGGAELFDEEEKVTVAAYILSNIEDVIDDFDNANYQKLAKLAQEQLAAGKELSTQFFIQHPDPTIQQLAINLITSPYELSENWEKRFEITLQTQKSPELNFTLDSVQALKRFRLRKIVKMCQKNQEEIKRLSASGDVEKMMIHLKVQQKLIAIRNDLAGELGTVILS